MKKYLKSIAATLLAMSIMLFCLPISEIYADSGDSEFIRVSDDSEKSYKFTIDDLHMQKGDILELNVHGDPGDVIQVHFNYIDETGNNSSTLIGGLGGTSLDSNGNKTVSFTAPCDVKFVTVKIVYNYSQPTYDTKIIYQSSTSTTSTADTIVTANGTCGENLTWTLDSEGTLTISGTGDMTGMNWDSCPWKEYRKLIKRVIINKGVTSIGEDAFSYCTSLESITIPDSVTSIYYSAFEVCSNLESITIPDSVTSIGGSAFYNCSSLKSISIPDSVTSIGASAFYLCSSLESITISDSVTNIGASAFDLCSSLESINVSESNKNYSSEDGVLFNKDKSTILCFPVAKATIKYNIPDSVTSIDDYTFSHCSILKSIIIPDSVTSIGSCAFDYCTSLESITIPDSVTSIGSSVFYSCSNLESITIPDSVTSIGGHAFFDCSSLELITIPDSVISIGDYAFECCSNLKSITIPDSVTSIGSSVFYSCSNLESITIPDSVINIGDYAFECCSNLKSITIPDSVTSIGYSAFYYCTSLESITIFNPNCEINFSISKQATIKGYKGSTAEAYAQKYNITFIALDDEIPVTTTTTTIATPKTTTTTTVKTTTTTTRTSTTTTTTSSTTTSSTTSTTTSTKTTTSTTISSATVTTTTKKYSGKCGEDVYYSFDNNGKLTLSGTGRTFEYYDWTSTPWKDFAVDITKIVVEDGITHISSELFGGLINLINIDLPDTLNYIGHHVFYNCVNLSSISLPPKLTKISEFVFCDCTSLSKIDIPDSVTEIEFGAFYGCSSLKEIDLPNNLKAIDMEAFYNCSSLSIIKIPESVIFIGPGAFCNCSSLKEIYLPNNLYGISIDTFENCFNMTDIYILNPECSIDNNKDAIPSMATIHGYKNSTAESYANKNSRKFVAILPTEITTTTNVKTTTATVATTSTTTTSTTTKTTTSTTIITTSNTSSSTTTRITTTTLTTTTRVATTSTSKATITSITTSTNTSTTSTTTSSTTATTTIITSTTNVFDRDTNTWSFINEAGLFWDGSGLLMLKNEIDQLQKIKDFYNKPSFSKALDSYVNNEHSGSCYGMTTLALISFFNKDYLSILQEGADNINNIKLDDNLKSIINYYSSLQLVPEIRYAFKKFILDENSETKRIQKIIDLISNGPVLVCYQVTASPKRNTNTVSVNDSNKDENPYYTHAVIAYDIVPYVPTNDEDAEFFSNLHYIQGSDTLKMIKVYDPNYYSDSEDANIFVNAVEKSGEIKYYWGVKEQFAYNKIARNKTIMFVSNDTELLERYGLFSDTDNYNDIDSKNFYPELEVNTDDPNYDLHNIYNKTYRIDEPIEDDEPYALLPILGHDSSKSICDNYALKYNNEDYKFKYNDNQYKSTELKTSYANTTFSFNSEIKSATFNQNIATYEVKKNSKFTLTAISDSNDMPNGFYEVIVMGTMPVNGKIICNYDAGLWHITSSSPLSNIDIYATNGVDCNNQHRSYSAKYNSITIHYSNSERSKIMITEKTDTEIIDEVLLGDVDNDGQINSVDASSVLAYYARISTNQEGRYDKKQILAADVNNDGSVNSVDASKILAYYAYVSTTKEEILSIEEYLKK